MARVDPAALLEALRTANRAAKKAVAHLAPFGGSWCPTPAIHRAPAEVVEAAVSIAATHRIVPSGAYVYDEVSIDIGGDFDHAAVYSALRVPATELERQVVATGQPAYIPPAAKAA